MTSTAALTHGGSTPEAALCDLPLPLGAIHRDSFSGTVRLPSS